MRARETDYWKSWVTEVLVCMIWFLFTPLSVPGEREMLTDEGRQKSDEGLRRGVNELFPQAVLLTMRVSIEPLMTGGCSIAHILDNTPPSPPPFSFSCCILPPFLRHTFTYIRVHTHTFPFPPKQWLVAKVPIEKQCGEKHTMPDYCIHISFMQFKYKLQTFVVLQQA